VREAFHGDLARLGAELSGMCAYSGRAMRQATTALLTADLALAEQVVGGDAKLDRQRARCEVHAQGLLALQAPVAHDLRMVLAAVYCADKIERMGDLAAHVADTVRVTHPHRAVPAELDDLFRDLGRLTAGMADRVGELITTPAESGFAELEDKDSAVDALNARVLTLITGLDWMHGAGAACTLALLARFYERFGDQAVSVAKRLEFAITGALPS
jgi:phosphate transport system protein